MTTQRSLLIDALLFQALWWCAALLRDQGVGLMVSLLVLHTFWLYEQLQRDLLIPLAIAPLGWLVDSGLVWFGVLHFNSVLAMPIWMLLLWLGLALSLLYSLAWLRKTPLYVQALLGAVSGSLSYFAAQRLGTLTFGYELIPSLALIAAIWLILLPLLLYCTRHLTETVFNKES